MTNVDIVRQIYDDFATGNVPAVLGAMDPSIQWLECPGMPFMDSDAPVVGPNEVLAKVFMKLGEYFDQFEVSVSDIFGSGDRVCMEGYYEGVNKASGKRFKAQAAHIWTLKEGKLARFYQAVDTVTIMR